MNNQNLEDIDFLSLTTEEAEKLGLNAIFEEEDGTYDWIYCMNMMKDMSMFKFYFKIVGLCFLPIVIMMIWMAASSRLSMSTFLITMLSFGGVLLVVIFAIWLVNTMYGGKYMMIYQMNDEGITFRCANTNFPKDDADRSGKGIGLENTRRRLELMYAGRYTWEQSLEGDIYHVCITLKTNYL